MGGGSRRLVVVDRHQLFVSSLALALDQRGVVCRPVATAELTAAGVLKAVAQRPDDIVLLSMDLGGAHGIEVLTSLHRTEVPVVALVDDEAPRAVGEALWAGADAVASRTWSPHRLVDLVGRMRSGRPAVPDSLRQRLVGAYENELGPDRIKVARLSVQERNLLSHLMEGHGVAEVAAMRTVSEATVRTQARTVMRKLEVSSQLAAVAVARRAGFRPGALREPRTQGRV